MRSILMDATSLLAVLSVIGSIVVFVFLGFKINQLINAPAKN